MYKLADANVEIIIRDNNLRDAGEITKLISWECTINLNDKSVWQIDTTTNLFSKYGISVGQYVPKSGVIVKRDNEILLSGPVTDIKATLSGGERKTTIFGCDDLHWLDVRDCYPVISGPTLELDGNYYWTKKRGANGLYSTTTEVTPAPAITDTTLDIKVGSVIGYVVGLAAHAIAPDELIGTIASIDEAANILTITLDPSFGEELEQDCGIMQLCTPNNIIVDDPAFTGYDVRVGSAETVAKGLVYDNAADGACTDIGGSRVVPNLHIAPDSGQGFKVTSHARGENLLTQVNDICSAGGVNFGVHQEGTNLYFDVYNGADLTQNDSLIFSVDRKNLKAYDYKYGLPTANFVMVYGTGMAAKKMVYPNAFAENIATFGRIEGWTSAGSPTQDESAELISAGMRQTGAMYLKKSSQNASVTAELWETENTRYLKDFRVGDIVGVIIDENKFGIPVTAIHYTVPSSSGASGSAVSEAIMKAPTQQMKKQKLQSKELSRLVHT